MLITLFKNKKRMTEIICNIFLFAGTMFILLAAIGIIKMPDFYMRISVTTKAATLGIGLILAGAAFYFKEITTITRIAAIIFFVFLTAPVAAHIIGKASYIAGVELWKNSVMDQLKGKLDEDGNSIDESEKMKE